jgi:hypothetical protein
MGWDVTHVGTRRVPTRQHGGEVKGGVLGGITRRLGIYTESLCVERRENGGMRVWAGEWEMSGILLTVVRGRSVRSSDRGKKIYGEYEVISHCETFRHMAMTIGRLSCGERLRILCAEGEVWHGDWVLPCYWTWNGD